MPAEDQLAAQLRARLHAEVNDIAVRADLAAVVRQCLRRRALALRVSVAVMVVLAIASAGAFVAANGASSGRQSAVPNVVAPGNLNDVNYVVAHTAAAIDSASDKVAVSHVTGYGNTVTQAWSDLKTGRTRIDILDVQGTLLSSQSYNPDPPRGTDALFVDYVKRTWYTEEAPMGPAAKGLPFGVGDDVLDVQNELTTGALRLVGTQQVDGQEVLHLQVARTGKYIIDLLVDEKTFLPIRETTTLGSSSVRVDLTWLVRTTASLTKLDLAPPAGYTHLPNRPLPSVTASANG